MRCIAAVIEDSCLGEVCDRRLAVSREAFVVLPLRLRDMEMKRTLQLLIRFGQSAAELLIGQILGVDAEIGKDIRP